MRSDHRGSTPGPGERAVRMGPVQPDHPVEPTAIRQVWGLASPTTRGPRARVTLEEVVRAGVQVADESGFDAVTLAVVARRLGLTTTAIYRYVDSKETLSELMVDQALGDPPSRRTRRMGSLVDVLWERYAVHPWLATFPLSGAPRCPHAFAWLARLLEAAETEGVQDPLGVALAVDVVVRGYAATAQVAATSGLSPELTAEVGRRFPALAGGAGRATSTKQDLDAVVTRLLR